MCYGKGPTAKSKIMVLAAVTLFEKVLQPFLAKYFDKNYSSLVRTHAQMIFLKNWKRQSAALILKGLKLEYGHT